MKPRLRASPLVLIIGHRKPCLRAALSLGLRVILWSPKPISPSVKKKLEGFIEIPFQPRKAHLSEEMKTKLRDFKPNFVIGCVEGSVVLAALVREFYQLKGLNADRAFGFHDKSVMKSRLNTIQIPMTPYVKVGESTDPDSLIQKLGLPLVLKPIDFSGAQDVFVCRDPNEVRAHLSRDQLAETYIRGTELSVETLLANGKPLFHNVTLYLHPWKKSYAPAQLKPTQQRQLLELNDRILQALGATSGMTHAEFYLTRQGFLFGEVAHRPPGGYYMDLIRKAYSFNPWKTYLQLECGMLPKAIRQTPIQFASILMLHPGEGTIAKIRGWKKISTCKGVVSSSLRFRPGQKVPPRRSTSSEVGHLLITAPKKRDLFRKIKFVERNLQFVMNKKPSPATTRG